MIKNWDTPEDWGMIDTIDAHTAGEPLRIITGGLPEIPGKTILEKRCYVSDNMDFLRTGLIWEPRGHADMYGAIVTEPVTSDGDLGVIFMHNEGYSTMCGHGIIALATVVLDTGMIKKEGDSPVLKMDTPAGRVTATAHRMNGKVKDVSFLNVPSFVYKQSQTANIPEIGTLEYDVVFGGAFYAICCAEDFQIGLNTKYFHQVINAGRQMKRFVMNSLEIKHPFEKDLSFLYGTIFVGLPQDPSHHSRNVCVFAEGEVDRSPTGTGVSARAALHYSQNELKIGQLITIESIIGTCFDVQVVETTQFGAFPAVIPEVTGSSFITGQNQFYFNPEDPLKNGFILR